MIPEKLFIPLQLILLISSTFFTAHADERDTLASLNEQKAQLQKEIARADRTIARTDSIKAREAQRNATLKKRMQDDIAARRADIDELQQRLGELKNEVRSLTGRIRQTKAQQRSIDTRREYLADQLIQAARALHDTIEHSLPWNREQRLARVTALERDLENDAASIEEALARLMALMDEEVAFGDDIVLQERPVQRNDGSTINARVLRIGNLWMAYVDAEEQSYGVLRRDTDSTFVWNEELNFAQREAIRTAIGVKDAKKAPQIVKLPVQLDLEQESEASDEN